jgi:hypothetical protein
MPPEQAVQARSLAALELWQGLRSAYDAIEDALASPERHDLGPLGERIVALENELRPLVGELAVPRSRPDSADPAVAAIWRETDAVVASLAERQPMLVRAALDARSATADRLESVRAARGQLRSYRAPEALSARLTSRHA